MKLQTYTADSMTIESDDQAFKIDDGLWAGNTLYQLYQQGSTPYAWHKALFDHARAIGLTLFSSPSTNRLSICWRASVRQRIKLHRLR